MDQGCLSEQLFKFVFAHERRGEGVFDFFRGEGNSTCSPLRQGVRATSVSMARTMAPGTKSSPQAKHPFALISDAPFIRVIGVRFGNTLSLESSGAWQSCVALSRSCVPKGNGVSGRGKKFEGPFGREVTGSRRRRAIGGGTA